ncbi:MAG: hypothetical protein GEU28_07615 [Dehalococcoidia bacterium]|nr:hypothetical protein [Dehalococcoidia bacterium]
MNSRGVVHNLLNASSDCGIDHDVAMEHLMSMDDIRSLTKLVNLARCDQCLPADDWLAEGMPRQSHIES